MFGPNFNDYYREALERFNQDLLHESDEQILGSEIDNLADFYFKKYALVPLVFDRNDISYDIKKEVRTVPAHQRERGYSYEGDLDFEYEIGTVCLAIGQNPNLDWIKKLSGPTHYLDGFEDRLNFSNTEIVHSFIIKGYGSSMDEDRVANEVNTQSERLLKTFTDKNTAIASENEVFLMKIKEAIKNKKNKVLSDKDKINNLTQKIKIPLKQKVTSNATKINVDVKQFVKIVKPTPKLPEEYTLEESILKEILNFVDNQCKTFEKTPSSYKSLGEEQMRDIILSALNGIFEGNATGETFAKKGKTDIHLKIEKGEILIFECKNWGGEKIYLDTITQLIGYVTWRQNYGVVIMFCKNKDFSKILDQIPEVIQKHPQFISGYKEISPGHYSSNHSLPEDTGKIIKVHHLIYNIYSE